MKAKDLLKILLEKPNAEIVLARDEEGNGFGTLETQSIEIRKNCIVLYPYEECLELSEIEGGLRK